MDGTCRNDIDNDSNPSSFIVYVIRVDWQERDVTYFHASSSEFFIAKNALISKDIQPSSLFSLRFSTSGRAVFSTLSPTALQSYLNRQDYAFPGRRFDSTVLRSLLLGIRVQDYLQSAATVINVTPLVIRVPRRPHLQDILISPVRFITESGHLLEVLVDDVIEHDSKHLELACSPLGTSTSDGRSARVSLNRQSREHANRGDEPAYLPSLTSTIGLLKNSRLLLYDEENRHMSPAQVILDQCYQGTRPVVNRNLLDRLYGQNHSHAYAGVTRRLISIKKHGKETLLTPAQSEAVRRYGTSQALALTGPPGSGKTLVAAAMATSYCEGGNQLVLVPSPSGLPALAQALVALDTTNKAFVLLGEDGELRSLHGRHDKEYTEEIDREDFKKEMDNNELNTPDSINSLNKSDGMLYDQDTVKKKEMNETHMKLDRTRSKKYETFRELDNGRNEIDAQPHIILASVDIDTNLKEENHQETAKKKMEKEGVPIPELDHRRSKSEGLIILATVDTVLKMMSDQIRKDGSKDELLRKISEEKESHHAQQLLNGVTKIIVDEANQLPEPALVALTQCFPGVQTIAAIGDARQLLPMTFYGLLSSQLAGSHVLDLFQRKLNVPSIQMTETHRHSNDLMPYSELFYGVPIPSTKLRRRDRFRLNVLSEDIDRNCLLVEAPGWKATQVGDSSWINDVEINALMFTLKKLREAGQESIMIICLYEAQRQLALATLPDFYVVLTVEEAQGREADIVIVLTTVDKLTVDLPFMCPNRCNVATSRHREALIIMGKQKLLTKFDPWSGLFEQQYFDVTYCDYEKGIFTDPPDDC